MDTIMPVKGCSPVGSTQVNFGPKSLKADLKECQDILKMKAVWNVPKETFRLRSNEMDAVLVSPIINLQLFPVRYTAENNNLLLRWELMPVTPAGNRTCMEAFNKVDTDFIPWLSPKVPDWNICI